jgi:hypothetical protein
VEGTIPSQLRGKIIGEWYAACVDDSRAVKYPVGRAVHQ